MLELKLNRKKTLLPISNYCKKVKNVPHFFFQISFLLEDPCVCIFLPTPRAFFKDAQEVLKNIS